jgi:hypothetical protein
MVGFIMKNKKHRDKFRWEKSQYWDKELSLYWVDTITDTVIVCSPSNTLQQMTGKFLISAYCGKQALNIANKLYGRAEVENIKFNK